MNTIELSNEFDTLLSSYSHKSLFGEESNPITIELDEYEKSIFLTKAQEELLIELYSGRNHIGSFEETEEIRRYLDSLIKTSILVEREGNLIGLSKSSIFFKLPKSLLFLTYESVDISDNSLPCNKERNVIVKPITQDEYFKVKENPFKGASEYQVLRLDNGKGIVELISKYNITKYIIRYITIPEPIILTTLPDHVSINGHREIKECSLHPLLHRAILDKAVSMVIATKALYTTENKEQ